MEHIVKVAKLIIGSTEFANKDFIPVKYTCDGENVNPPITVENIPPGTKSLALIIEDPDAADGTFYHWIVWNIRPKEMIIENTSPGTEGKNSFGKMNYHGPCPTDENEHRYFFKLYALDTLLNTRQGVDKQMLEKAMRDHILAEGEIMGIYKRSKNKSIDL